MPLFHTPEAFLPAEVCNAIYNDIRWLDQVAYLLEDSKENLLIYLCKDFDQMNNIRSRATEIVNIELIHF